MTFSVAKTVIPAKSPRLLAETHRDPRGLWIAAIAISAIAHLALGWAVVRILLVEGKPTAKSQEIIRVEAVTVQPTPQISPQSFTRSEISANPQPQPSSQTPAPQEQPQSPVKASVQSQPQIATPTPIEKKRTWRWFNSSARNNTNDAAESALADSSSNNSEAATGTRQWRTAADLRANRQPRSSSSNASPLLGESDNIGQRQSSASPRANLQQRRSSSGNASLPIDDSGTSARGDSRSANSNARRFGGSASGSDSIWNDSPTSSSSPRRWNSGRSNSGSSAPSNSNSSPPPAETPASRGATASLGAPRLTRPNSDVPDRLAAPVQSSQQLSSLPFGVRLEGRTVLEVTAIIEANGKASVYGTRVVSGNLGETQAQQLGKQLVESWTFRPTYMGDRAVAQEYLIQLSLAPLVN